MLKTIFTIILMGTAILLSGQSMEYLHWQQLNTADNLRNTANSFLFKDSQGFLWIGSETGLQRYDGLNLKNFVSSSIDSLGILGKNIQGQIVEDRNNDLWITTYQSLNHYKVDTEKFTHYPIKDKAGKIKSGFHSCGISGNTIWLIHKDSLRPFDIVKKEFIDAAVVTTEREFNRGVVRQFGDIVMIFIYNLKGNNLRIFEFKENILINTHELMDISTEISAIYPVTKDRILVGNKYGLSELTLSAKASSKPMQWKGEILLPVYSISAIDENKLLLITDGGDVFHYNKHTREILKKLNAGPFKDSDPDNKIIAAISDDKQNIWMSSKNNGIYFTHPAKAKFSNLAGGNFVTNLIQRDNGEIWVFTDKKIIIFNEQAEKIREVKSDRPNASSINHHHLLKDKKGRLWTSYYLNECSVNLNSYNFSYANFSQHLVTGLCLTDGRTIFTGLENMFICKEESNKFELVPISGTDNIGDLTFIYQDARGDIVTSEENNELVFYDSVDFSRKRDIAYSDVIYDMFMHPGDSILWIGGTDGLVSLNYNTEALTYFNKKGNIPDNIFGILPDEEGNLWLSSNSGIYRFNPATEELTAYNEADGIGAQRFTRYAHCKLRDGRLAFGNVNGLLIFDPKDINSTIPLAVPQVTDILIDGKERTDLKCYDTGATNIEKIEKLVLQPEDNKLDIHFVALEYSNPEDNQIRYRLLPEETEWKIAKNGGKCQYTNVEPGDYVFEIQAANSDEIWNTDVTDRLALTFLPPFKKTIWFKIIILLLVSLVAFIASTIILKLKRRKEQAQYDKDMALEKQRLRIARDMHDDLGSRLSAISLKTAMLENKFEHPKWKLEMEKLTKDAQEISITIRETIWAVDARNDTLGKLIHYLTSYTKELFDVIITDPVFEIADDLPEEQMVSGKIRRMVFLSYKEILNNIVKHAKAHKVVIKMKKEKDHFILTITDDGIGFNLAEKEKGRGNGLDNMRYRMAKIGGTCRFLPTKKGTSIQLDFNLID